MSKDLLQRCVVVSGDPEGEGRRLADEAGAELVTSAAAAEAAVRSRLGGVDDPVSDLAEVERLDALIGDHDADDDRRAAEHLDQLRQAVRLRPPTPSDVADLRLLGQRVAAIGRIRQRTEAEARSRLESALGTNTLVVAEPVVRRKAGAAAAGSAEPPLARASLHDRELDRFGRPGRVLMVLLVVAGLAGAGALLVTPVPVTAAVPVAVAVGLVVLLGSRERRRQRDLVDRRAATANLARAAESATRGAASSLLRSGPGADADPTAELVRATPAARAAVTVERRAQDRWRVGWDELGRAAPDPAEAQAALAILEREAGDDDVVLDLTVDDRLAEAEAADERMRARRRRDRVLDHRTLAQLRAEAAERNQVHRALVLVEPFRGLGPNRRELLRRQLDRLPASALVTIVVADESSVPDPTG